MQPFSFSREPCAGHEHVLHALENAPLDDEPETVEEREAVARAREDVRQGRVYSTAELVHELGL